MYSIRQKKEKNYYKFKYIPSHSRKVLDINTIWNSLKISLKAIRFSINENIIGIYYNAVEDNMYFVLSK